MKTTTRHGLAAAEAVAGAAAGAAIGSIAGAPGAVASALIGSVLGGAAGIAGERATRARDAADEKLDETIGIYGGDLGAPCLKYPPAIVGAYSSGSCGGGAQPSHAPASGPMSNAESDD
jgi:hypothetical protein